MKCKKNHVCFYHLFRKKSYSQKLNLRIGKLTQNNCSCPFLMVCQHLVYLSIFSYSAVSCLLLVVASQLLQLNELYGFYPFLSICMPVFLSFFCLGASYAPHACSFPKRRDHVLYLSLPYSSVVEILT